jgi:hypothetical protein
MEMSKQNFLYKYHKLTKIFFLIKKERKQTKYPPLKKLEERDKK